MKIRSFYRAYVMRKRANNYEYYLLVKGEYKSALEAAEAAKETLRKKYPKYNKNNFKVTISHVETVELERELEMVNFPE